MKPTNVPTERVGPIIKQLVEERWPEWRRGFEEPGGFQMLAEKVGCDEKSIRDIISQRATGVSFDSVDTLFCALGRPDIWQGVLSDVYAAVDLRPPGERRLENDRKRAKDPRTRQRRLERKRRYLKRMRQDPEWIAKEQARNKAYRLRKKAEALAVG